MKDLNIDAFNKLLRSKSMTTVCAESITAGFLASSIASIPGA
jgi:nicotinamide mononucleotide (NMN) deamidase PncC